MLRKSTFQQLAFVPSLEGEREDESFRHLPHGITEFIYLSNMYLPLCSAGWLVWMWIGNKVSLDDDKLGSSWYLVTLRLTSGGSNSKSTRAPERLAKNTSSTNNHNSRAKPTTFPHPVCQSLRYKLECRKPGTLAPNEFRLSSGSIL